MKYYDVFKDGIPEWLYKLPESERIKYNFELTNGNWIKCVSPEIMDEQKLKPLDFKKFVELRLQPLKDAEAKHKRVMYALYIIWLVFCVMVMASIIYWIW